MREGVVVERKKEERGQGRGNVQGKVDPVDALFVLYFHLLKITLLFLDWSQTGIR